MLARRILALLAVPVVLSTLCGCPSVDVGYSATPTSGVAPLQVQFRDTSIIPLFPTRVWSFGDGGTSHEAAPVHLYTKPGVYTVTLRTYSALGFGHMTKENLIAVGAAVPDVAGMTQVAAQSAIAAVSLVVGSVTEAFSETVPAGQVISQDPAPGVTVVPGTAVNLVLSKGPDRRTVPHVVGMTQLDAQAAIASAGLTVGIVLQVFSETIPAGQVISQDPSADALVAPATVVNLTVSKGPEGGEFEPVPNVVGVTQSSAEGTIAAALLVVGVVSEAFSETISSGYVISQDPVAGTFVLHGTAVDLTVSKGPDRRTVPNLTGLTLVEAQNALAAVGLRVGTVTSSVSETVPEGHVAGQDPAADARVVPGAEVDLTVSTGPAPGTVRTFGGMPFAWIPAGSFDMGCDKTAAELSEIYGDRESYYDSEQPLHHVVISQGFWMAVHEVTQAEWVAVMGENPSEFTGDDHPVEKVSWDECQDFIAGLNVKGEGVFRLPTEAEREYACRAGTTTEYYFGDDRSMLEEYEWVYNAADFTSHAVARKKPNPWGLYDMHGNVVEWCADWYGKTYYSVSPEIDPLGPDTGERRVRRGGSFRSFDGGCRSSFRTSNKPGYHLSDTGVRLCHD